MHTENFNQKLEFYLFGPPEIKFGGQVLDITRRQVRTLLYLLASDERPISYQTLHFLFWSDKPEKECRRNLSHLFTHIRNCLPDNKMLIQNRNSARLNSNLIYSDVLEFRNLSDRRGTENDFDHLNRANQLYLGPFLEGKYLPESIELEKYVEQIRLDLEARYLKNLSSLIQIYKKLNKSSKAIECAEAYLNLDSYNEDIFTELLILHSYLGNSSKIIQLYNDFSKELQDQLCIKPSRKTRTIFEQIIAGPQGNQNATISPEQNTINSNSPLEKYLLSNLQTLQKITTGHNSTGGIVLITGEVGMGKSELITNYIAHSSPELVNFRITCTPATQKVRLYPFRELARKLISPDHQNGLNANFLTENLKQIADQLSKPVHINATTAVDLIHFLFEREYALVRELFGELSQLPLAINIIIENIEWIDEESLEMILLLLEKPLHHQITFICSYCCKKEDKLRTFLQDVQSSWGHLGTMRMDYLTVDDIQNILEEQLGMVDRSRRFSEQLLQMTSGNPFFISGILQETPRNKMTPKKLSSIGTIDIPNSITQRVNCRFERLTSNEKKFLQYAAVKDSSFSFEDISKLLNLPSHDTLEVVNDLICQNFIDHKANAYFIKNQVIQKSILANLNPAQQQMLQGALGQLLNKSPK